MIVTILKALVVVHAVRSLQQLWELRRVQVEDHGTHGAVRGVRS